MKRIANICLFAALLAGSVGMAHAELKIGVIDIQRLAAESPQAKAANDAIQNEFTARWKTLQDQEAALQTRQDKLTKDAPTMTELQRSAADKELRDGVRDLQAKRSAFEDDLNARKQDENAKISRILNEEIATFARAQNFDLILADGVAFASISLDVTDALLQSLAARRTGAATTPARPAPPASIAKP